MSVGTGGSPGTSPGEVYLRRRPAVHVGREVGVATEVFIYEGEDRAIEVTIADLSDGSGRRRATMRQLSGPPLSREEWRQFLEGMVRRTIDAGARVIRTGWGLEDENQGERDEV
jgi:hypothetical protein